MHKVYRYAALTAFGGLTACLAASPNQRPKSIVGAEQHVLTPLSTELPYRPYPHFNARACYNADTHDAADLCAQWRAAIAAEKAADSAWWAVFWTILSLMLSGAGLAALIYTLLQTDKSLKIAQKDRASATRRVISSEQDTKAALELAERNATTAEKQLLLANQTAKHQLRAYVGVTDFAIVANENGVGSVLKVNYSNGGQTPALNCTAYGRSTFRTESDRFTVIGEPVPPSESGNATLLCYASNDISVDMDSFPETTEPLIRSGVYTAFVNGFIKYDDIFGDPHITKFSLFMDAGVLAHRGNFAFTVHGNEAK